MDYNQMREELADYNWDDGFDFPQEILNHPQCDLAMALTIFEGADGFTYLFNYRDKQESAEPLVEWLDFIRPLYEEILASKYPKTGTPYQAPYTQAQKDKLQQQGVSAVFLSDLP